MTTPAPTTLASTGLRRHAATIAGGIAGASALALLAAGSLAPLFATSGMTIASVVSWLGGLGSNALANWLDQWARTNLAHTIGQDPEAERKLLEQLARDLQGELSANDALAADVATLLQRVDAIPIALDALQGQGKQQIQLLHLLLADLQFAAFHNERLHDVTLRALQVQGDALRGAMAQSEEQLRMDIEAILAEVKKLQAEERRDPTISGGVSISGNVGTYQGPITITGGVVDSIIGSQTTIYGTLPTRPTSSTAPSQEDVDEQRELLEAHRRTLAVYLRRQATLGSAHTPPEVFHGIREARAAIQRIKATLQGWGAPIADHPDDEEHR